MRKNLHHQQGVMLIEALVGILIFSIGILAIIGLQAVSVKNTIDAQYRVEASFLANEVIGNMWSECGNGTSNCGTLNSYNTASGSSSTMVAWRNKVASRLPGITVSGTNSPLITVAGNTVSVTVYWQVPGSSDVRQFSVIAQINSA